jgi:hypothetical protein
MRWIEEAAGEIVEKDDRDRMMGREIACGRNSSISKSRMYREFETSELRSR